MFQDPNLPSEGDQSPDENDPQNNPQLPFDPSKFFESFFRMGQGDRFAPMEMEVRTALEAQCGSIFREIMKEPAYRQLQKNHLDSITEKASEAMRDLLPEGMDFEIVRPDRDDDKDGSSSPLSSLLGNDFMTELQIQNLVGTWWSKKDVAEAELNDALDYDPGEDEAEIAMKDGVVAQCRILAEMAAKRDEFVDALVQVAQNDGLETALDPKKQQEVMQSVFPTKEAYTEYRLNEQFCREELTKIMKGAESSEDIFGQVTGAISKVIEEAELEAASPDGYLAHRVIQAEVKHFYGS